jgi:hypothetical protein
MRKHGPLGNKLASPKTVLSFAENLILCPTEDAVIALLQRDREAARGAYAVAGDAHSAVCTGRAQVLIQPARGQTPFFLLAVIVRDYAKTILEKYGDVWPGPIIIQREK